MARLTTEAGVTVNVDDDLAAQLLTDGNYSSVDEPKKTTRKTAASDK